MKTEENQIDSPAAQQTVDEFRHFRVRSAASEVQLEFSTTTTTTTIHSVVHSAASTLQLDSLVRILAFDQLLHPQASGRSFFRRIGRKRRRRVRGPRREYGTDRQKEKEM